MDVMLRYEPATAAGPMHTDSSAALTWRESRSASEWTATVATPSSLHAAMMRSAISPRLATRTFLNIRALPGFAAARSTRLDREELLSELDGLAVLRVDRHDRAALVRLDLVHELHRLDDAERLSLLDVVAELCEGLGLGIHRAIERADDRRRDDVKSLALARARRTGRQVARRRGRGGNRDGRTLGAGRR